MPVLPCPCLIFIKKYLLSYYTKVTLRKGQYRHDITVESDVKHHNTVKGNAFFFSLLPNFFFVYLTLYSDSIFKNSNSNIGTSILFRKKLKVFSIM